MLNVRTCTIHDRKMAEALGNDGFEEDEEDNELDVDNESEEEESNVDNNSI